MTYLTQGQNMINPTKAIYGTFYFLVSDNEENEPLWFYAEIKEAVRNLAYARLIDPIHMYSLLDPYGYIVPSSEIESAYLRL